MIIQIHGNTAMSKVALKSRGRDSRVHTDSTRAITTGTSRSRPIYNWKSCTSAKERTVSIVKRKVFNSIVSIDSFNSILVSSEGASILESRMSYLP